MLVLPAQVSSDWDLSRITPQLVNGNSCCEQELFLDVVVQAVETTQNGSDSDSDSKSNSNPQRLHFRSEGGRWLGFHTSLAPACNMQYMR